MFLDLTFETLRLFLGLVGLGRDAGTQDPGEPDLPDVSTNAGGVLIDEG